MRNTLSMTGLIFLAQRYIHRPGGLFSRKGVYSALFLLLCSSCMLLLSSCNLGNVGTTIQSYSGKIRISGSTALYPLVHEAAASFMKLHPEAHIDVEGGGSVTGLQDVSSGKSAIGDSDIYADFAKYPDPNMTDHIVCVIPFAMVVNPDVSLKSLTTDQIIRIFAAGQNQYSNWDQLGGPDLPIVPIVRPATSGTRDTFRKYILGGRDENGQLLKTDSSDTVRQTVAKTPGAIGYLALSVINDTSVQPIAIDGLAATPVNIISGHYAFWGYEHMYTLGDDNPLVHAFLDDYMYTSTVQTMAQNDHYIPIAQMKLQETGSPASPSGKIANSSQAYKEEDYRRES